MNRKMTFLARAVVYLLAFLVPPVLVFLGLALVVLTGRLLGPATKPFRHPPKGKSA